MHLSVWNVALQTVNFLVLAWLLRRFLFKPVRAVVAKRQEAIEASMRSADAKKAEAERLIEEYRVKSAGIEGDAERARERALGEAEREARKLRDEAARRAQAELDRAKTEIDHERSEALRALEAHAAELAASIAGRLLAESFPDSDAPFLWRATASIDALDVAQRAALGRQAEAGRVEVSSSRPLDAPTKARFESWLASLAGGRATVAYEVDSALIAGVEVRLPTGVWRSSLRASLDRVRAELESHAAAA